VNGSKLNELLFGCGAAALVFVIASVPESTLFAKPIRPDNAIATLILFDCGFIKILGSGLVWWGEATDEPAREDARPTEKPN